MTYLNRRAVLLGKQEPPMTYQLLKIKKIEQPRSEIKSHKLHTNYRAVPLLAKEPHWREGKCQYHLS